MRAKRHPYLDGVLVREDGMVFVPANGSNKAHWAAGSPNRDGYRRIQIRGGSYLSHRLVAETFIPNPENKREVDHINRNTSDNRVENLRWVTRSENNRNTVKNDRVDARGGVHRYEDKRAYDRERIALYKKDRRCVRMADGRQRWLPMEQATKLLKLPVKERVLS